MTARRSCVWNAVNQTGAQERSSVVMVVTSPAAMSQQQKHSWCHHKTNHHQHQHCRSHGQREQWARQRAVGGIHVTGDSDTASSSTRTLWTTARPEGGRGHCRWQQAPPQAAADSKLQNSVEQWQQ